MNCKLYDDVLGDYVDSARRPAGGVRLAAFEAHLRGCERCQARVADFSIIRRTAADLDEIPVPPGLWPRVASAIDEDARQPWWQRRFGDAMSAWVPAALAASLALIVGVAVWLSRPPVEPLQAPQSPSLTEAAGAPAEQHYEEAIAGLQQMADAQRPAIDPQTLAVLQQNLAVVDRAITESRAALSREPASAAAQDSLLDALDTKVSLLQDTVALASDGADVTDYVVGSAKELNQ